MIGYWIYPWTVLIFSLGCQLIHIPMNFTWGGHFYWVEGDAYWLLGTTLFFAGWFWQFPNRFHQWLVWTGWVASLLLWWSQHWVWTYVAMEATNFTTYLLLASFKRSHTLLLFYVWSNTMISFLFLWLLSQDLLGSGGRWMTHLDHWLWTWILAFKLGWFPFNPWLAVFYTQWSPLALLWLTTFPKFPYLGMIEHHPVSSPDLWIILFIATLIHAAISLSAQTNVLAFFTVSMMWNNGLLGWLAIYQTSQPYLMVYTAVSWLFLWAILTWKMTHLLNMLVWLALASLPPFQTFFVKLWVFQHMIQDFMPWFLLLAIFGMVRAVAYYLQWSQRCHMTWQETHHNQVRPTHLSLFFWESILLFGTWVF